MPCQVVVFHMNGCGPCEEYLPRFRKIASGYKNRLSIRAVNITRTERRIQATVIKFKVEATPTTLVIDDSDTVLKRKVGALDEREIERLLEFAVKKG
jgi:thiol-disulfide isomerase/thioredoxin